MTVQVKLILQTSLENKVQIYEFLSLEVYVSTEFSSSNLQDIATYSLELVLGDAEGDQTRRSCRL